MMNDFVRYIRKHKLTLADDVVITHDNLKMLGELKHLGMSNHGIYNRVYRAREKYVRVYGVPKSCNSLF